MSVFIRPLAWLDIWQLAVWTYGHQNMLKDDADRPGLRRLTIVEGKRRHPGYDKMTTLRNLVTRARRVAEVGNLELTGAALEQLDPGAHVPWSMGEDRIAVHVGVVCNPHSALYCGSEMLIVLPGQVAALNERFLWSAVNAGETVRIHLILYFRQREIEEAP